MTYANLEPGDDVPASVQLRVWERAIGVEGGDPNGFGAALLWRKIREVTRALGGYVGHGVGPCLFAAAVGLGRLRLKWRGPR